MPQHQVYGVTENCVFSRESSASIILPDIMWDEGGVLDCLIQSVKEGRSNFNITNGENFICNVDVKLTGDHNEIIKFEGLTAKYTVRDLLVDLGFPPEEIDKMFL
jgi:hypothetical protein